MARIWQLCMFMSGKINITTLACTFWLQNRDLQGCGDFFLGRFFTFLKPGKYELDTYKGFLFKKNGPNLSDFDIEITRFLQ